MHYTIFFFFSGEVICLEWLTEIALPTVGCLVDYARAANCFRRPCAAASCSTFQPEFNFYTRIHANSHPREHTKRLPNR